LRFEFDPAKSSANKAKPGIDFVDAQALWNDPERLEVPARFVKEARFGIIGRIGETVWSAVVTYRHDETTNDETIRIISVRRARDDETRRYRGRSDVDR
jgi:uncharacterized DUF497 family protein